MNKITEKTAAESLKDAAYFLVTQQETVDGSDVEALRRAKRDLVEKALVEPKYLGLYNAVYGTAARPAEPRELTINSNGVWAIRGSYHICIPCKPGDKVVIAANSASGAYYAFLSDDIIDAFGASAHFADDETGRYIVSTATVSETITAPSGTNYLYIAYLGSDGTTSLYPVSVKINGVEQNMPASVAHMQTNTSLRQVAKAARLTTGMVTEWEVGTLGTTTGVDVASTRIIRTKRYYLVDPEGELAFTGVGGTDRSSSASFYDAEKNFVARSTTTPYAIPEGACYVRFAYGFTSASSETVDSYGGVDAVAADWSISYVSPMENKNRLIDDLMAQNGIVAYWANGKKSMTTASVVQEFSAITLNGYSSGNAIRIRLSGSLMIGTASTVISDAANTIRLKGGHTYKVKIEALGGEVVTAEGATFHVRAGLYTGTSTTSVMTMAALTSGVNINWQTFTPEVDGDYKLAMLANANNTYTNFKVRVVLTDITEWVSA